MMRTFHLTDAQFQALGSANENGYVHAHGNTMNALVSYGLAKPEMRFIEKPAGRRGPYLGATTKTWSVYGFKITTSGRDQLNRDRYWREQKAKWGPR